MKYTFLTTVALFAAPKVLANSPDVCTDRAGSDIQVGSTVYDNDEAHFVIGSPNLAGMESKEHTLLLKDGRTLAYHTFQMPEGEETNPKDLHPVLFFHGCPSCGLFAGVACARDVEKAGGRVYGIDRPGMGKTSSPYDQKSDADINLESFIDNVWELVQDQGWKEFSVIGVSAGGTYALAFLASYLRKKSDNLPVAHLAHVSLAGAIILSAGSEAVKDDLFQFSQLVENAETSKWSRFKLAVTATGMGSLFKYVLPYIPLSWTKSMMLADNKIPADQELNSNDEYLLSAMNVAGVVAAQGGYPGIYNDLMIVLRTNQPHEEYLREVFQETNDDLPAIGIFHGLADPIVPPSHAKYLHEMIFGKQSQIFQYEGLGHESMIVANAEDYAAFAATGKKK